MKLIQLLSILFVLSATISKGLSQDVKYNLGGFNQHSSISYQLKFELIDFIPMNQNELSEPIKKKKPSLKYNTNTRKSEDVFGGKGGYRERPNIAYKNRPIPSNEGLDFIGGIAVEILKTAMR